jgi:hypothetical protein
MKRLVYKSMIQKKYFRPDKKEEDKESLNTAIKAY